MGFELPYHLTVGDDKDHLELQVDILQPYFVGFCVYSIVLESLEEPCSAEAHKHTQYNS